MKKHPSIDIILRGLYFKSLYARYIFQSLLHNYVKIYTFTISSGETKRARAIVEWLVCLGGARGVVLTGVAMAMCVWNRNCNCKHKFTLNIGGSLETTLNSLDENEDTQRQLTHTSMYHRHIQVCICTCPHSLGLGTFRHSRTCCVDTQLPLKIGHSLRKHGNIDFMSVSKRHINRNKKK